MFYPVFRVRLKKEEEVEGIIFEDKESTSPSPAAFRKQPESLWKLQLIRNVVH